jgi:CO dehydrogenase nickel-insertion accessory protein CooC1
LLGSVQAEGTTVVADLEAGIGTLTRLSEAAVDVTVVVVEPTPRSIDVARRAVSVAREQAQGRLVIVANKVADDADRARIREAFGELTVVEVPVDGAVDEADRLGVAPLDHAPGCPAVAALEHLAALLAP